MRKLLSGLLVAFAGAGLAFAGNPESCGVPASLLTGEAGLARVDAAVTKDHKLTIAVIGSGSSILPGPDGAAKSFPARLEAALTKRLPGVVVKLTAHAKPRQTAAEMAQTFPKIIAERKPTLVIWQTGTVDAIRGVEQDAFRIALHDGVEMLQSKDIDVVLANMQYSPRTELMIAINAYADSMRLIARE